MKDKLVRIGKEWVSIMVSVAIGCDLAVTVGPITDLLHRLPPLETILHNLCFGKMI